MQGLELPDPPLMADTDLPPAIDQPPTPPTPPGPSHQFPEAEDTTGQGVRRNVTGVGARSGPRVLCTASASTTDQPVPKPITLHPLLAAAILHAGNPTVTAAILHAAMDSSGSSSTDPPVTQVNNFVLL